MRQRILLVVAVAAILVVAVCGVALAAIPPETTEYTVAQECYECHQGAGAAVSRADFSAATVDYTKCATCHDFQTGLPGHYHLGRKTCTSCHNGVTKFALNIPPDATFVGGYPARTPYGYFAYPTSLSTTPEQLHALHDGGGWVERAWGSIVRWPNGYPSAGGSIPCSGCHAAATCTACHTAPPAAHADHAVAEYPAVSVRQATGRVISYAASTCINPSCHALAAAGTPLFVPECGSCHAEKTTAHGYSDVDHVAEDAVFDAYVCSDCHTLDLATAHGDPTAIGASCPSCHPSPRDELTEPWDQSCVTGGCHGAASTAPMHAEESESHTLVDPADPCLECHDGTSLDSLHTQAVDTASGRQGCLVCHTGVAGEPASGACGSCHFTIAEHYGETTHVSSSLLIGCGGEGCHTNRDLMTVHEEKNPAFGCGGCHLNFSVALQIESGLTGCGDCHENVAGGHRSVHWANPLLQDGEGPHYAYYTGSASGTPTGDCAGCHTSNLLDEHMGLTDPDTGYQILPPQYDSAGNALSCETCHASADATVLDAIAGSGLTACENCHAVHGPIPAVHTSAFVDSAPVPCGNCHSSDLTVVHGGGYTSSAGLSGCDICHGLYEGELGALAQTAIAVTNDTRCTACHPAYHTATTSHTVTSTASISCGACHQRGATTIDVARVHGGYAGCGLCHSGTGRIVDVSAYTAECVSCHVTQGVDYHPNMALDHTSPLSTVDTCTGCHHNWGANPTRGHDITRHRGGCTTCHNETTDLTGKTALCSECHLTEGVGTLPEGYHTNTTWFHTATDDGTLACAECHQTTNLRDLHVTQGCDTCHRGLCTDCHRPHNAAGGALLQGASCARVGCHPFEGTDYHSSIPAAHTFSAMPASCTSGASCHIANTLPEEHTTHAADYGYVYSCQLCHWNIDPARIPADASADCASCHTIAPDHGAVAATGDVTGSVTSGASGAGISGATVWVGGNLLTTAADGSFSALGLPLGDYPVEISATGFATWTGSVTVTGGGTATVSAVLAPVPVNLARFGTASSSYVYPTATPAMAIDGLASTYWRSDYNGVAWLAVDLGSPKTVESVTLSWFGVRYAKSYRIETSDDGVTWTPRYTTTSGTSGISNVDLAPVTARYVRLYCYQRVSSDYRLYEFEVWGF